MLLSRITETIKLKKTGFKSDEGNSFMRIDPGKGTIFVSRRHRFRIPPVQMLVPFSPTEAD